MPGDDIIGTPNYVTTKAVTIDAGAAAIWPWLVQIGRGRGGLYSFDALDRLFGFLDAPSAQEILPQFQLLKAGDIIPMGHGDWPVKAVDPMRSLVLGDRFPVGGGWSWTFMLDPISDHRTRLISRNRALTPSGTFWRLAMLVLDAAALVMTRQMLLNLKVRAERSER
ncbi:MAG: SRPBCC family protein [Chloroflexi bacterium]|nr:SRPBCC family protein [Chloroflexota bacterium]